MQPQSVVVVVILARHASKTEKRGKVAASMATRPGHPATSLSATLLATLKNFNPVELKKFITIMVNYGTVVQAVWQKVTGTALSVTSIAAQHPFRVVNSIVTLNNYSGEVGELGS